MFADSGSLKPYHYPRDCSLPACFRFYFLPWKCNLALICNHISCSSMVTPIWFQHFNFAGGWLQNCSLLPIWGIEWFLSIGLLLIQPHYYCIFRSLLPSPTLSPVSAVAPMAGFILQALLVVVLTLAQMLICFIYTITTLDLSLNLNF